MPTIRKVTFTMTRSYSCTEDEFKEWHDNDKDAFIEYSRDLLFEDVSELVGLAEMQYVEESTD